MDQDREQIDYAIGVWGTANMSDSSASLVDIDYEQLESVVILVMTLQVNYYRSTTGEVYVATQNSSEQSFQYTTASATTSYTITIPKAMADTTYVVTCNISTLPSGSAVHLMPLNTGRTTTTFTLSCSGALPIGAVIDFIVRDR